MGSMSVSSCICCMVVSCVHPVAVLTQCCILHDLLVVNAGRGCMRRPYRSVCMFFCVESFADIE